MMNINTFACKIFAAATSVVSGVSVRPALAGPDIQYPLVFTSVSDLEKLGLSQQWPIIYDTGIQNNTLPKPGLPIGCYLYAGPATRALISISEEFLARYKAKGFSRESLCMGLASRALYDPETGRRLPTYILRWHAARKPGEFCSRTLRNQGGSQGWH
jgi:hypothetical protein